MYQDGLMMFTFNYTDVTENPIPSSAFEQIHLGFNMRGRITDLQIFSEHMDGKFLSDWTSKCIGKKGNIFSWKKEKISIIQVFKFIP